MIKFNDKYEEVKVREQQLFFYKDWNLMKSQLLYKTQLIIDQNEEVQSIKKLIDLPNQYKRDRKHVIMQIDEIKQQNEALNERMPIREIQSNHLYYCIIPFHDHQQLQEKDQNYFNSIFTIQENPKVDEIMLKLYKRYEK